MYFIINIIILYIHPPPQRMMRTNFINGIVIIFFSIEVYCHFLNLGAFFIMKPGNCRGASLKCNNIRSKSSSSSVIPLNFLSICDFICDAGESTKSVKAAFCIPSFKTEAWLGLAWLGLAWLDGEGDDKAMM
uniref:Uncharacterized protein n=1 Tax=Glossina austeni TaxID=7395 RepID=A0A1A9V927_GLOAU